MGSVAQPTSSLTPGVWFWRLHGKIGDSVGATSSPTWEFVVSRDTTAAGPSNTSWGSNGDVNGDGFSDIFVVVEDASMQRGVAMYLGGPDGISTAGVVVGAPGLKAIAPAGDVNGDGLADLLYQGIGPAGALTVCVLEGTNTGLSSSPRCAPPPEGIDDNFAVALGGLGDTNLDGYADVFAEQSHLFGPLNYPSFVLTWRGGTSGLEANATRFDPSVSGMALTAALPAGDIDGDGFADLAATQWSAPGGAYNGSVWVAWGSAAGFSADQSMLLQNPPLFEYVGAALAPASDLTNDGRADLQTAPRQSGTACRGIISLSAARVQNVTVSATDCSSPSRSGVPIGSIDGDAFGEAVTLDSASRHLIVLNGTNLGPLGVLLDIVPTASGNWSAFIKATGRIASNASFGFAVPVYPTMPASAPFSEVDVFTAGPGALSPTPTVQLLPPTGYTFPRTQFSVNLIAGSFGMP